MSQRQELQAQISYQIYALIDPRDSTVRYVGMSRNAQRRLFQHLLGDSRMIISRLNWVFQLQENFAF